MTHNVAARPPVVHARAGAVKAPKKPFVAIVGGSKVSTKITVVESLMEKADKVIIGGGMIFTFYKARGLKVRLAAVEGQDGRMWMEGARVTAGHRRHARETEPRGVLGRTGTLGAALRHSQGARRTALANALACMHHTHLASGSTRAPPLPQVGSSLVEDDKLELAKKLEGLAKEKGCELLLPVDVVVADKFDANANSQVRAWSAVGGG